MKIYLDGAEMKVTAVVAVVLVIMVMTLVPEVAAEIHTVSAVKEAVLTLVEPLYAVETLSLILVKVAAVMLSVQAVAEVKVTAVVSEMLGTVVPAVAKAADFHHALN